MSPIPQLFVLTVFITLDFKNPKNKKRKSLINLAFSPGCAVFTKVNRPFAPPPDNLSQQGCTVYTVLTGVYTVLTGVYSKFYSLPIIGLCLTRSNILDSNFLGVCRHEVVLFFKISKFCFNFMPSGTF